MHQILHFIPLHRTGFQEWIKKKIKKQYIVFFLLITREIKNMNFLLNMKKESKDKNPLC